MRIKNVDFPQPLLEARQNGKLVIFAGAGVSIPPPSNYPDFDGLAERVAGGSLSREKDERVDHFLGRLKDQGVAVHAIVHRMLSDEQSHPNQLHRALLNLFDGPAKIRLVTTNFDMHFNSSLTAVFRTEAETETYTAPALPLGSSFSGIVYLHGNVAKPADRLILTDSDFGSAYLADGWATRFLQQLFQHNIILFVGYSHNDTVVDYLARGLTPESRSPRRYALTLGGNEAHWKRLGITPIVYPVVNDLDRHVVLSQAIEGWGELIRASVLDSEEKIRSIVQQPVSLDPDVQDYIEDSCRNTSRLQFFTRHATRTDWLRWAENKGLLAKLFSDASAFTGSDQLLAFWFARNFVCDHPEDALAVVQRHNARVSPQLWANICHAFHSKKPASEVVARWVPILLATEPQETYGADWLEYMLCAREFPRDEAAIFLLLEHLTEIRIDLKKKTWPTDVEDVDVELSARGSEHWLKHAWHQILKPNLDSMSDRLLLTFSSNILRAYALLQSSGKDLSSWDQLSGSRAQIDSSAHGGPPDTIDLVVDIACEALRSTIANHPDRANFFVDYWSSSECRLLRRMAIFGVAESSHWSADEKITWILQHKFIHLHGYKAELFLVLKQSFGHASESLRIQVLKAAQSAPDFLETRTRDYAIYNILGWLKESAPNCAQTEVAFKEFRDKHGEFGKREHPELDWWIGPVQTGGPRSPLSTEEVLALEPDELWKQLQEARSDELIGPSREGLIREVHVAVSRRYEWSIRLARKLVENRIWDADIWKTIIDGWRGTELQENQWEEILRLFLDNPKIMGVALYESSNLVENGIKRDSHSIPTSCFELARGVAEKLWYLCDGSSEGRVQEPDDWLAVAINHPAGNVLLFVLQMISDLRKNAKQEWSGIPEPYKAFLAEVLSAQSYSGGLGCAIIASQLFFLFSSDPQWALENVLPPFSFSADPKKAIKSWHGFLTWGNWNLDLLPHLMKYFTEAFGHLRSGFNERQRQAFCRHLAGIACHSSSNPSEPAWLRQFLTEVTTDERAMWAEAMSRALQGMKSEGADGAWKKWIGTYWQSRLDGIPLPLDRAESKHMTYWALALRECFPEAVERISKSPIPQIRHSYIYEELSNSEILKLHPSTAANFVLLLLHNRVCETFGYFDPVVKVVQMLKPAQGIKGTLLAICQELAEQGFPGARLLRDELNERKTNT